MESESMKLFKSSVIAFGTISLIFLGACGGTGESASNKTEAAKTETATTTTAENTAKTETTKTEKPEKDHNHEGDHSHEHKEGEHSHGGQVVESGQYHLELVAKKESDGMHMDFFLEKGEKHEAINNAKVTADVQLPDGTQKTVDLKYKPEGKHYFALLPGTASGQYQVRVNIDVAGEKVNGRFKFNN
jgi:hypothetical protein